MANFSECRSENKFSCGSSGIGKETVCIETNRILDSCKDRDCFENVRVYLTDMGNEIIERTNSVRTKEAVIHQIFWFAAAHSSPVPLQRLRSIHIRKIKRTICTTSTK